MTVIDELLRWSSYIVGVAVAFVIACDPPGTTRERWILTFDPPLNVERGIGRNGVIYSPITLYPLLDRSGDQISGKVEWHYSDDNTTATAGISGTMDSRVRLVIREGDTDLVRLDGVIADGIATGAAEFVGSFPGAGVLPERATFTLRVAPASDGEAKALANRELAVEWRATFVEGSTHGYEAGTDQAKLAVAASTLQRAAALAEQLAGVNGDKARAITSNNLANCYLRMGRYADAELSYERAARAAATARFGFNDRDGEHYITSNLIQALVAQGKPTDAALARLTTIDAKVRPYRLGPERTLRWLNP